MSSAILLRGEAAGGFYGLGERGANNKAGRGQDGGGGFVVTAEIVLTVAKIDGAAPERGRIGDEV